MVSVFVCVTVNNKIIPVFMPKFRCITEVGKA